MAIRTSSLASSKRPLSPLGGVVDDDDDLKPRIQSSRVSAAAGLKDPASSWSERASAASPLDTCTLVSRLNFIPRFFPWARRRRPTTQSHHVAVSGSSAHRLAAMRCGACATATWSTASDSAGAIYLKYETARFATWEHARARVLSSESDRADQRFAIECTGRYPQYRGCYSWSAKGPYRIVAWSGLTEMFHAGATSTTTSSLSPTSPVLCDDTLTATEIG
jgi:hypothetical protein